MQHEQVESVLFVDITSLQSQSFALSTSELQGAMGQFEREAAEKNVSTSKFEAVVLVENSGLLTPGSEQVDASSETWGPVHE